MGALLSLISSFWDQELEICLLGLASAGKSSFTHVLNTGEFDPDLLPTVGFNLSKTNKGGVELKTWDLGGQQNFRQLWCRYAKSSDAIVYMIDPTDTATLELSIEELQRLLSHHELAGIPLLILFNKLDLMSRYTVEQKNEKMLDILQQLNYDQLDRHRGFIPISCKEKMNIDKALEWLIDVAKKKKAAQWAEFEERKPKDKENPVASAICRSGIGVYMMKHQE